MWPKSVYECEEVNKPYREKFQSGEFVLGEKISFMERWSRGTGKLLGFERVRSLPYGPFLIRPMLEIIHAEGQDTGMKPGDIVCPMELGIYVPDDENFKWWRPGEVPK